MHEKIMQEINLDEIPVEALRPRTMGRLSCMLNKHKIIPSPEPLRLPRDYRGIAHLMDISTIEGWLGENPIEKLLMFCGTEKKLTLGQLQSYFEQIDRYDVLDDTKQMFYDDAVEFENKKKCLVQRQPCPVPDVFGSDANAITIDDIIRLRKGDGPQFYDAFILYVDADKPFAEDIVNKMEQDLGLKVCDKDRDLILGLTFQHAAIMKLISERCNKLFVILTDDFIQSDRHTFFVKYAQALTYEQGIRKVIPCTYKKCNLPTEYSSYVRIDYERDIEKGYFWKRLQLSLVPITGSEPQKIDQCESEGVRIEEITLEDKEPNKNNSVKNAETPVDLDQKDLKTSSHLQPNDKVIETAALSKSISFAKSTDKKPKFFTKIIRSGGSLIPGVKSKNKKSKKKQMVYAS